MLFPTSNFSRLVSADDHIGPHKPNGGTVLRAVGPHRLVAKLCALLGSHRKGGSKAHPTDIVMGSSGGTVSCPNRTFFGLTTCHLEAKQAAALHVLWNG